MGGGWILEGRKRKMSIRRSGRRSAPHGLVAGSAPRVDPGRLRSILTVVSKILKFPIDGRAPADGVMTMAESFLPKRFQEFTIR